MPQRPRLALLAATVMAAMLLRDGRGPAERRADGHGARREH